MTHLPQNASSAASRRDFLKGSAAVLGGSLALGLTPAVHAAGDDVLRIGLIGCGGRGSGAANEALQADKNNRLVAMGDAFPDRLASCRENLRKLHGERVTVNEETSFVGFDAYKKVLASGVDVVLLTTPPHFRPAHLQAAVDAGVHVFAEKPVAVDAPGIRSVLESVEKARQKKLSIVSGLCWRYDSGVRETMKRALDGAIGDIVAINENYLTGGLWHHDRQPKWSDMEFQVRNWLYFTWLSGDFNTEQHVHSLDKGSWMMHDLPPLQATAMGGRQVRNDPKYGNVYDHFSVIYEYPDGVKMFAYCRQQDGCANDVSDYFVGTKGQCNVLKNTITGPGGETLWRYDGPKPRMYQVEHNELFAAIRAGQPINNGNYMATSTMLAILGRMAAYTGKTITWDQAMKSQEDLTPPAYEWGDHPVPPVALPGLTQFA